MADILAQLQSTLGDKYAIEHELRGGGMSRVFVAVERSLNRKVVIRVLSPDARYYQSLVPGSELVILEQSAHLTMHDEPEHYNAVLRDFLQRADATARKNHK